MLPVPETVSLTSTPVVSFEPSSSNSWAGQCRAAATRLHIHGYYICSWFWSTERERSTYVHSGVNKSFVYPERFENKRVELLNKLLLFWCCVTCTHTKLMAGHMHKNNALSLSLPYKSKWVWYNVPHTGAVTAILLSYSQSLLLVTTKSPEDDVHHRREAWARSQQTQPGDTALRGQPQQPAGWTHTHRVLRLQGTQISAHEAVRILFHHQTETILGPARWQELLVQCRSHRSVTAHHFYACDQTWHNR